MLNVVVVIEGAENISHITFSRVGLDRLEIRFHSDYLDPTVVLNCIAFLLLLLLFND